MGIKFSNNAVSVLHLGISTTDTTITVVDAGSFPTLGAGDFCYLTLISATSGVLEIVKVTAISVNNLTCQRAQDDTTAAVFNAGDVIELRLTAGMLNDIERTPAEFRAELNARLGDGAGIDVTGDIACDGFNSTGIDDNATGTALTLDAAGNMGLGVTPKAWRSDYTALQIGATASLASEGGVTATISENSYRATDGVQKYITSSQASLYEISQGKHTFLVAPSGTAGNAISFTTAMSIENDGDVVMGTLASGSNHVKLDGHNNGKIQLGGVGSTSQFRLTFFNSNGLVGNVVTNGSSTSYNTSSDYRLKENVIPMSGSIDRLKALKPSRFNFISDASKTVDGFLAHEAGAVVPECATGEKDALMMEEYEVTPAVKDDEGNVITEAVMGEREVPDYQGIDQSKLVPLLVSAIQELTARLEALEA